MIERERLAAAVRVRQPDPALAPSVAELRERLFVEARRYAEKANVVDHVEDRSAFVRDGVIRPPRPEERLDLRSAFTAAQALCRVLQEMSALPQMAWRQLARGIRQAERRASPFILRRNTEVRGTSLNTTRLERPHRSRTGPDYGR
ncbi:hypothetical protein [Methylobacterium sp. Leaf123]|uniref:hypothetical protein n=1 Tax=Methylobacterium sp. Leaf123 TaxID=1736264 RepID=UPI000A649888|nr:hypothetical protein [Methylobacterium sp. Leaf123]